MTSTPPSRPPTERTLLGTRDPLIWAEEFCRIFNGATVGSPQGNHSSGHVYVDEGTMVTWFANAFMVALDLHNQEVDEVEEELDLIEMTPFDQDDEPDEEPTLEEKFKEGFDEGR